MSKATAVATKFKKHEIDHYLDGETIKGYLVVDAETGTEYGFVYKKVERRHIRGRVGNISQGVSEETRWHFQVTRGERGYSATSSDGDGYDRQHATDKLIEAVARRI